VLVLTLLLLIGELLVVRDRLSCFECNFDNLVADLLLEAHEDAIILLSEGETTLVEEVLDILELSIVFVLIFDLLLKGSVQLLGSIGD